MHMFAGQATLSDFRLLQVLPQLVQGLKKERHLDNPLARFLLRRAIANPAGIGHQLFWHLVTEIDCPHQVRARPCCRECS